uniref:hypothetical protein n=1 Tax=Proteus mirabilis TaxID=584 RepID=UPI00195367A7
MATVAQWRPGTSSSCLHPIVWPGLVPDIPTFVWSRQSAGHDHSAAILAANAAMVGEQAFGQV